MAIVEVGRDFAGLGRACGEWGGHEGCQASKCGVRKVEQKSWHGRAQAATAVSGRESQRRAGGGRDTVAGSKWAWCLVGGRSEVRDR